MEEKTIDVHIKLLVQEVEEADVLVKTMLDKLTEEELNKIKDFKLTQTLLELTKDAE